MVPERPIRQRPAIYVALAEQAAEYALRRPTPSVPWSQRPAPVEALLERAVDLRAAANAAEALALTHRQTGLAIASFDATVFDATVSAADNAAELPVHHRGRE